MARLSDRAGPPRVLCIGGVEATGVAGLAADSRAVTAWGGHALPVVTAVTAQGVEATRVQPVEPGMFDAQLSSALDAGPAAVKVGLVPTLAQAQRIAAHLAAARLPLVLDPVCANSHGQRLVIDDPEAILATLLPLASLVTPNRDERAHLARAGEDTSMVAQRLGVAVLDKGGHGGENHCRDTLALPGLHFHLSESRVDTPHQRGTGCCLSAVIATAHARGYSLADAVVLGKWAVGAALRRAYPVGPEGGALGLCPEGQLRDPLPALRLDKDAPAPGRAFASCADMPIGIYPVVDRAGWLERLLPCGITTIQLRVKDLAGEELEREIAAAIAIARRYRARLFINDHWQLALRHGAWGVHLGQEDLAKADLPALQRAGLRLGISTHCVWELARALTFEPSYVACGPVYSTTSKDMPWTPHGPGGLRWWRDRVGAVPLVAIGGIDEGRLQAVSAAGADGAAMISALLQHEHPEGHARQLISVFSGAAR